MWDFKQLLTCNKIQESGFERYNFFGKVLPQRFNLIQEYVNNINDGTTDIKKFFNDQLNALANVYECP